MFIDDNCTEMHGQQNMEDKITLIWITLIEFPFVN